MSYRLIDLARDLRTLLEMPVAAKSDLRVWNELALRVQSTIRGNPEVSNQVPHEIWHFFSDADIRREDPDYGKPIPFWLLNEGMVQEYVSNLYGRYGVAMEAIAEP